MKKNLFLHHIGQIFTKHIITVSNKFQLAKCGNFCDCGRYAEDFLRLVKIETDLQKIFIKDFTKYLGRAMEVISRIWYNLYCKFEKYCR